VERWRIASHGKLVAVKHLKVGRRETGSLEYLRRLDSLLLELHIMDHGPLKSHPNILTLIGYGWNTDEGGLLPYILVHYCANGNLRQYLTAKNTLARHK
jgi:serine/threonine protein kinase